MTRCDGSQGGSCCRNNLFRTSRGCRRRRRRVRWVPKTEIYSINLERGTATGGGRRWGNPLLLLLFALVIIISEFYLVLLLSCLYMLLALNASVAVGTWAPLRPAFPLPAADKRFKRRRFVVWSRACPSGFWKTEIEQWRKKVDCPPGCSIRKETSYLHNSITASYYSHRKSKINLLVSLLNQMWYLLRLNWQMDFLQQRREINILLTCLRKFPSQNLKWG